MKLSFNGSAKALALLATVGLAGCGTTNFDNRTLGALGTAGAAAVTGASSDAIAAAAVLGIVLGGLADRAYAAGCRYSSTPATDGLNFQNRNDGIYLVCPQTRPGNKFVEELRSNPNWVFVNNVNFINQQQRRQAAQHHDIKKGPVRFGLQEGINITDIIPLDVMPLKDIMNSDVFRAFEVGLITAYADKYGIDQVALAQELIAQCSENAQCELGVIAVAPSTLTR
jgi:hypothetical protein